MKNRAYPAGTLVRTWYLTSHLIDQAITDSTLDSARHINTCYVGAGLYAYLCAAFVVFQRIF